MATQTSDISSSTKDLRAVTCFAAESAQDVLGVYERARPGDAAAAAYVHPLAKDTRVRHILGAAAHVPTTWRPHVKP